MAVLMAFSNVSAQPDPRYGSFDWVMYRNTGEITSFSSGYSYMYIGTAEGGIHRYNLFGSRFEEPITEAQGLGSNSILAVYFDKVTGILWALTLSGLEYSGNREGQWTRIQWVDLGVRSLPRDVRLGSSNDHIWMQIGATYFKLDHISGIQLGMSAGPQGENITWSSKRLDGYSNESNLLMDYTVQDGWLYDLDRYMNSKGEYEDPVALYIEDQFQQLWVGTNQGTVLVGNMRSKYLTPYRIGTGNTDVTTVIDDNSLWIAGRLNQRTRGITRLDPSRGISEFYDYGSVTGFYDQSVFSGKRIGDEIWFGTDSGLLIFDMKTKNWSTLNENSGIRNGTILSLAGDTSGVWLGGSQGLLKVDSRTRSVVPDVIEDPYRYFINDVALINNVLWVVTDMLVTGYDTENDLQFSFDPLNFDETGDSPPSRFWKVSEFNGKAYLGTSMGVFEYIPAGNTWNRVTFLGAYSNLRIHDLAVNEEYCFIGFDKGFTVVNLKNKWHREYSYSFIGRVFQIILDKDIIWLGTDKGLIKFFWKNDVQ